MTPESVAAATSAEKLLFLVADPVTRAWINGLNPTAESLEDCYEEGRPRTDSYREMTERMLSHVHAGLQVCAAFYGHPGVFVTPAHEAIRRARQEGFPARMLPGISAEDCLFADLGVDPAQDGCQSFEATDFLARPPRFDPTSGLVLWQVGIIGEKSIRATPVYEKRGLRLLTDRLLRSYPGHHRVVVYEAAQFPVSLPLIRRVRLRSLARAGVSPLATLYVPPRAARRASAQFVKALTSPRPLS